MALGGILGERSAPGVFNVYPFKGATLPHSWAAGFRGGVRGGADLYRILMHLCLKRSALRSIALWCLNQGVLLRLSALPDPDPNSLGVGVGASVQYFAVESNDLASG